MTEHLGQIATRLRVPEHIRRMLKRRDESSQACRELYEQLIKDFRPRTTIANCIVFDIAKITCSIEEFQMLREATFNAAVRTVIEQCLKDTPSDDPEAQARYILSGARKDAARWLKSKNSRKKINATLQRAGYDQQWIRSQAYVLAAETLERLDRSVTVAEERRRRLIAQLGPIEAILERLDEQSNRLIEGDFRSTGKVS